MIDDTTTRKIARLARIAVSDQDVQVFTKRLNGVLSWVEQLQAVDTSNVEPLASVLIGEAAPQRKDDITDGGYAEKVLANAPETVSGFFVVPKVVE